MQTLLEENASEAGDPKRQKTAYHWALVVLMFFKMSKYVCGFAQSLCRAVFLAFVPAALRIKRF